MMVVSYGVNVDTRNRDSYYYCWLSIWKIIIISSVANVGVTE